MQIKKAVLICSAMAMLWSGAAAGASAGIQEEFAAANRDYAAGRYAAALARYLETGKGADDWRVPYNIGNCYFKMGRYLSAKFHYLKARKLQPQEPAIARNIAMTNRHFRDEVKPPDPGFAVRTRQRLEGWVSMDALSIMLLLAVLLFNALLFLRLTRGKSKKLAYAMAFSLLLALFLGASHIARAVAQGRGGIALVWQEEAPLRSGPGDDNTVLFKVHSGLEVRIIDRAGGWVQVAASERIAGWIEKSRLVLI